MTFRDPLLAVLRTPGYRPVNDAALFRQLDLPKKLRPRFLHEIRLLLSRGEIMQVHGDKYALPEVKFTASNHGVVTGRIQFRQGGSAFLIPQAAPDAPRPDSIQIAPGDSLNALPGDTVEVRIDTRLRSHRRDRDDEPRGRVERIVERARAELVGRRAKVRTQFVVVAKRYRYLLHLAADRDPLLHRRAWHLYGPMDIARMRAEAACFVGVHDFRAFRAADCERLTTVRAVWRVELVERWSGRDDLVAVEVEGTAFLKNMVRVIVGTLVDVGRGRLPPGTVRARLADLDRTRAGMTAPADGLYLDEVFVKPAWRDADDVLRLQPPRALAVLDPAATTAQEDDE